jgi:transposase
MHIRGQSRHQGTLFPERLDELIGQDHAVRVVDAFVDSLDLAKLGFSKVKAAATGRSPYHPADLLKLYVYGYLNGVSSTRRLARECQRNIEVLWLLNRLSPNFKTIANFRAEHPEALVRVCRSFVQFCRQQKLFSGKLVAIDGSKFQADNNPDNVARPAELEKQLAATDRQIEQWMTSLSESESQDDGGDDDDDDGGNTQAALEALKAQRETLTNQLQDMRDKGLKSQALSDPDARVMRGGRVGYNVQSTVDSTHHLIIDHDVTTDADDRLQLHRMARRARRVSGSKGLTVLADGGYSNGKLLGRCEADGITVYLPVNRTRPPGKGQVFDRSEFIYDAQSDTYRCPAGKTLYKTSRSNKQRQYCYTTKACTHCPIKAQCTSAAQRHVTRHFDEDAMQRTAQRTAEHPQTMAQRKSLVEHPFGTLKRRMHGGRFQLRGMKKVKAEMALSVMAYNLTRAINVLGARKLCEALV